MARNPKPQRAQRRRQARFEPKARILIVCEGEKTEKYYFEDARKALGIQPTLAQVVVQKGDGTNPINIVQTAKRLKRNAKREGNAYDDVYCVFDRDEHAHYAEAIQQTRDASLWTIKSVPCFEYWLLLHFEDHAAPYMRAGDRSPGQCCQHDLKAHWRDYEKTKRGVFTELQGEREKIATRRAQQRRTATQAEDSNNPSTEVDLLLRALRKLNDLRTIQN